MLQRQLSQFCTRHASDKHADRQPALLLLLGIKMLTFLHHLYGEAGHVIIVSVVSSKQHGVYTYDYLQIKAVNTNEEDKQNNEPALKQ